MTAPSPFRTTDELSTAWRFVETTGTSVFLTGKAGTGKTSFLRDLRSRSRKTMVVVAPTGVAAINAGGVTIHSFFQLPFTPYVPGTEIKERFNFSKDKLKIIRALDLLVIDEISMVRSDLLDAVDSILRRCRANSEPFGGVQLLMIGDLQQLTPVVTPADEAMLRGHYETPYFFGSTALARVDYVTIQLTRVFRQTDSTFISVLNAVRDNRATVRDLEVLNSRLNPSFRPPQGSGFIRLTTHNAMADDYNNTRLLLLPSSPAVFSATVKGNFPEISYPTDSPLTLKPGAQVMFVRNDPDHRFYNGKIGHVESMTADTVTVRCPGEEEPIELERHEWENTKYSVDEKSGEIVSEVVGTFFQFPLRLAWAITIHKSQGLTFDRAIIDAGRSFAPGQVYVALSRCKTLEGIVLATPLTPAAIMTDSRVSAYISRQEAEAARSVSRLAEIEDNYFRQLLRQLFDFREITGLHERLSRLLSESCQTLFPAITRRQAEVRDKLARDVIEVTMKWTDLMARMPVADLKSDPFGARIRNSARYFYDVLEREILSSRHDIARVKSGNKVVAKRLNTLRDDLFGALIPKMRLLGKIADEGFGIEKYLLFKQQAHLSEPSLKSSGRTGRPEPSPSSASGQRQQSAAALELEARINEKRKKKKTKTSAVSFAPVQPKEPSHEKTFRSFRQGKTIAEIARERSLSESTINSHLIRCVAEEKMSLEEIVAPEIIVAVNRALDSFPAGQPVTFAMLRESFPATDTMSLFAVYDLWRRRNPRV